MQIDLTLRVLFKHDDLLKDRFEDAAKLFHFEVFLDVCFVLHRAEICLEEAHIQDSLVLRRCPTKGLPSTPLVNLEMFNTRLRHICT